jgi:membrane fusion protein, multidrug efflux system
VPNQCRQPGSRTSTHMLYSRTGTDADHAAGGYGMKKRAPRHFGNGLKVNKRIISCLNTTIAIALLTTLLSACDDRSTNLARRAALVRTETVQLRERQTSVTLTGEVQARFSANLSFRVTGRVLERFVDVGAHVNAGDVLARLDPTEQQADFGAATAAEAAAESQLRVAQANFDRQKALLANRFTTQVAFDQAQEALRSAESTLEAAQAQLGTAKDALSYTELRASAAGVITTRSLEVGQVVQAAQPVFTLAQDGERDAVFDVYESIFFGDFNPDQISLALVSDPSVTATGYVREVSPTVDPKSLTVRVKVTIQNPPAAMPLGSAVAGTARTKPVLQITVPWTALMSLGLKPAVWIVDPATKTVSLKTVDIGSYEAGTVLIEGGLEPGEHVVVEGAKLLSSGQPVTEEKGAS